MARNRATRAGARDGAVAGHVAALNETAAFFLRHGFEMEAVASEVSDQPLRYNVEVGRLLPLHAFSAGKAILATFGADELDDYFRSVERTAYTPQTLTDEVRLRDELMRIGRRGLARTVGEYTPGIIGIGRSVIGTDGMLLGAISIAIPAARATPSLEDRAAHAGAARLRCAGHGLNMAEIVNLRIARKARDRKQAEQKAAENRAKFGRTKAEKDKAKADYLRAERTIEGARRGHGRRTGLSVPTSSLAGEESAACRCPSASEAWRGSATARWCSSLSRLRRTKRKGGAIAGTALPCLRDPKDQAVLVRQLSA